MNFKSLIADAANIRAQLLLAKPYAVCPACSGKLPETCKLCLQKGVVSKFRFETSPAELRAMRGKHAIRNYQIETVNSVFEKWLAHRSTAVVLPTGTGKNRVMAMIAERLQPKRCILLAHRSELIFQSRLAMLERGLECEIEMGELTVKTDLFGRASVVLATVQTLGSGDIDKKRVHRFDPMHFDALLYDECFPAGTLVDGKPIEDVKVGDEVITQSLYKHKVLKTFKNKAKALARIKYKDGTETVCTVEHPIWDADTGGFVPAISLTNREVALRLTIHANELQNMQCGVPVGGQESQVMQEPRLQAQAVLDNGGEYEQASRFGRMKRNNPMHKQENRDKVSATLQAMGTNR